MNSRVYSMDEEETNMIELVLDKVVSKANTASSTMTSSLKNVERSGLFGSTMSNLQNQFQRAVTTGTNIKNKINYHKSTMFEKETMLASKIEDVNVPQDFVKSYDVKYTSIEDIQLSKNDDKSVNSGKDVDLLKDLEGIEGEKEELENINKGETEEVDYELENKEKKEELEDITKEDTEEVEYKDGSKVDKEELENIDNGETELIDANRDVEISDAKEVELEDKEEIEKQKEEANANLASILRRQEEEAKMASENSYEPQQGTTNNASMSQGTYGGSATGSSYGSSSYSSEGYTTTGKEEKEEKKSDAAEELLNNLSIMDEFEEQRREEEKNRENEVY